MANFAEAGVIFTAKDLDKFVNSLGRANTAIDKFNKNLDNSLTGFSKWESQVTSLGKSINRGLLISLGTLTTTVAGLSIAGVGFASSFEDAFADVTKTVDVFIDRTATARDGFITLTDEGQEFKDSLRDLSNEIPVVVEELSQIAGLGGQLGIIEGLDGAEAQAALLSFTETVAGLAEATNLSQELAATNLAQIANIFREEGDDIGDTIERLGSSVVELGNTSATTESKILNFSTRIAGAANTIGLVESEMLGIATAFASIGITAEAGSTAVNRSFLLMNEAVNTSTGSFIDNTAAINDTLLEISDLQADLVRLEAQIGEGEGFGRALVEQREAFLLAGNAVEDWGRQLGDTRREQLFKTQFEIDNLNRSLETLRATQGQAFNPEVFDEFLRVVNNARDDVKLTADEFRELFKEEPAEAFSLFIEGLAEDGDRAGETLARLGLNSIEAQRAFLAIIGASDSVREKILASNEAWAENTALVDEVSVRYSTLVSQVKTLQNAFRNTLGDLFVDVLPTLASFVKEAKEAVLVVGDQLPVVFSTFSSKVAPQFNQALSGISIFGEDFDFSDSLENFLIDLNTTIAQTDFSALGRGFSFIRENIDLLVGGLKGLAAVLAGAAIAGAVSSLVSILATLTSPIGLLISGATLAGIAWEKNFLGIRDVVSGVSTSIIQDLGDVQLVLDGFADYDDLDETARDLHDIRVNLASFGSGLDLPDLSGFSEGLSALADSVSEFDGAGIKSLTDTVGVPLRNFTRQLDNLESVDLPDDIGLFFAGLVNIVTQTPLDQLDAVTRGLQGIVQVLDSLGKADEDLRASGFLELGTAIRDLFLAPLQNLGEEILKIDLTSAIVQLYERTISDVKTRLQDAILPSLPSLTDFFSRDFFEGTALAVPELDIQSAITPDEPFFLPLVIKPSVENEEELEAGVQSITDSLLEGVASEEEEFTEVWRNTFLGGAIEALSEFESYFGIQSPSTLMAEKANDIMDGLAVGFEENTSVPEAILAIASLIDQGFNRIVDNIQVITVPSLLFLGETMNFLTQETIPALTNVILENLIPTKLSLVEVNNLELTPSVNTLNDAERALADTINAEVVPAFVLAIDIKKKNKSIIKDLVKEVKKLEEAYENLATAIRDANSAGSGTIPLPGSTPTIPLNTGGQFIVPPSVGSDGLDLTVHPGEFVQVIPANVTRQLQLAASSNPDRVLQDTAIPGSLVQDRSSNTVTNNDTKEFHLHVAEPVTNNLREDFRIMEAMV